MEYAAYDKYRPSRFEKNLTIPTDWREKRLKFIASHNDQTLSEKTDPDYVIEYVDISSVNLVSGITQTETLSFDKAPSRARRIVQDGDSIVSTVRTYLKAIATIKNPPDNMVVSTGFAVIRPKEEICKSYLSYFLQSQGFVNSVVAHSFGVSYPAINASDLVCLPVSFPVIVNEQQKIATFLDNKTQQIDQLIKKKKSLVEKLNEQRIAVITQAVTKGLDKNVKMKPSGAEWLGDVPEHWEVRRLKFMATIQNGRDYKDVETEDIDGYAVYGSGGAFKMATEYLHNGESVLFGRKGTIDKPMYVNEKFWTVDTMFYTKIHEDISPKFLFYSALTVQYQYLATQTALPSITQKDLEDYILCCPNLKEQIDIVEFIEEKTLHIDAMFNVNNKTIEKLEEYRFAIISDAVTGKIDVRNIELIKDVG